MKKKLINRGLIFTVFVAVFLAVYRLLTDYIAICEKPASVLTIIVTIAVSFAGFVLSVLIRHEKLRRFLKGTAAVFVIVFAAETGIFNLKAYTKENATYYVDFSDITTEDKKAAVINNDSIDLNEKGSIEIKLEREGINAIQLEFAEKETDGDKKGNGIIKCSANIKDDNFRYKYIRVGQKFFTADYGKCDFSFKTYGTLHSVKLDFDDVKQPVTLTAMRFYKALPFKFSELRFYSLILIFVLIYAVRVFEFYRIIYDRNSAKHKLAVIYVTALCSLSMLCFFGPNAGTIEYKKDMSLISVDPYIQTFDAFQKKQVYIDITPADKLKELDNPYDCSERDEKGLYYEWDRAYYNGKYYSYFGVAPVFVFYYPFYFISMGQLPSLNMTCVCGGMLFAVLMSGAIMAFIKRFIKKPNLMLVLLGIITSSFASGMYFNVNGTSIYTVQEIFGADFLMMCIWFGVEACGHKGRKIMQPVLFALSGLSFILCVATKPTIALFALVLAPLYLEVLFSKIMKLKEKLISVACFMIPIVVGMAGIMWYNNARFDSPFQFGAIYQLTVSNVSANSLRLSGLPYAILHYFMQPVHMHTIFPYARIMPQYMENNGCYVYSDFSVGALTLPYIFAGVCGLPFLLYHLKRKKGERLSFSDKQLRKYTYVIMLVSAIFVAWMNYCIAGIILRYVCDILPILTLMSVLVLLDIQQQTVSHPAVSNKTVCAVSLVSAATMILVFLELLSINDMMIYEAFPNISFILEDIICFWN